MLSRSGEGAGQWSRSHSNLGLNMKLFSSVDRTLRGAHGAVREAILAALVGILAIGLPGSAMAANPSSFSYIFLDNQDNIIGQSLSYCNNVQLHAGVTDWAHNPLIIIMQGSCDISKSHTLGITHFTSSTGKTIDYYCNAVHPLGTPFFDSPACVEGSPEQILSLGPFQNGNGL